MANLNAIKTAYNSILDGDRKYSVLRDLLQDASNGEIKYDLRTKEGKEMLLKFAAEYIDSQSLTPAAVEAWQFEGTGAATKELFLAPQSALTCDILNGQFCSIPNPAKDSDEFSKILGIDLRPYFRVVKDEHKMILYVSSPSQGGEYIPLFASNSKTEFINYLTSIKEEVRKCEDLEYCLDTIDYPRLQRLRVYTIAIAQGFGSIAREAFRGDISPVKKKLQVLLELLTLGAGRQEESYLRAGLTKVSDI